MTSLCIQLLLLTNQHLPRTLLSYPCLVSLRFRVKGPRRGSEVLCKRGKGQAKDFIGVQLSNKSPILQMINPIVLIIVLGPGSPHSLLGLHFWASSPLSYNSIVLHQGQIRRLDHEPIGYPH
mmetsp:Transcript_31556/g.49420  ORF Transcript_31556/g.49420 Transcript_31556/m.49420 type:complete len:122 (+) Transcript_31556:824-1189(+)